LREARFVSVLGNGNEWDFHHCGKNLEQYENDEGVAIQEPLRARHAERTLETPQSFSASSHRTLSSHIISVTPIVACSPSSTHRCSLAGDFVSSKEPLPFAEPA
jgi:hypothetical protein